MRVLFLTNFYPPHHIGGYEELCADVAEHLTQRGHHVSVLTSTHRARGITIRQECILRQLHPEVDLRAYRAALGFFIGRRQRADQNLATLRQVLTRVRPDVVLVWGMWNLSRALLTEVERLQRGRVAYYVADYWPSLPDAYALFWREPARHRVILWPKRLLGLFAERTLHCEGPAGAPAYEHVLCVSHAVREQLVQDGLPLQHAQVLYNGIDVEAFCNGTSVHQPPCARPISILFGGRLAPEKGVHIALEALAIIDQSGCPATLTVIGGGRPEYERALRRSANDLGVAHRVVFRGRVPRDQMPREMAQADILVVPSVWPEPLPRIAQEGMASGLAVIAARVGGIPEIVKHGHTGLTFSPGSAEQLAACVLQLTSDAQLRAHICMASRRDVAARFSISRMLDGIESYLEQVVAESAISPHDRARRSSNPVPCQ